MSLLRPAYRITIGKRTIDTTDEPRASTVTELRVELDVETPADQARLRLGQVGGLKPVVGDEVAVELGYADDGPLTRVFTGMVTETAPGLAVRRITALGPAVTLLHTFVDRTFEGMSAGDLVRKLAGEAGIAVAEAEPGIRFPAYVIDGRRSIHDHLRDLAALCGFDLYCDAAGALRFRRFTGGDRVHRLEYGKDLLELTFRRTAPAAAAVEAWGEGSGSGGTDTWAWLTKDFSRARGDAGRGNPVRRLEHPALRSTEAAGIAADAAYTAITRDTLRGWALCSGRPGVTLGDAVRLSGLPENRFDGTYQVRSITHRLTKAAGFTTTIGFRSVSEGA